jgi:hypothetical protein
MPSFMSLVVSLPLLWTTVLNVTSDPHTDVLKVTVKSMSVVVVL